jgi:hypothetical protein
MIITIHCATIGTPIKVWASTDDTVETLKAFIGERYELFSDEMTLMITQSHPYPLADTMWLSRLYVEHRHLTLLIHEGGEIHYGRPQEDIGPSLSQPIPERYIGQVKGRVILDFRYLSFSCLSRIRYWLYQARAISEIWLLGTHPHVTEILYAIAEDVLSIIGLHAIIIQNPAHPDYIVPYKSQARHQIGPSYLRQEALSYLYQHLLLDQYRDAAEEVEILIDGGLLPGIHTPQRYRPRDTT